MPMPLLTPISMVGFVLLVFCTFRHEGHMRHLKRIEMGHKLCFSSKFATIAILLNLINSQQKMYSKILL